MRTQRKARSRVLWVPWAVAFWHTRSWSNQSEHSLDESRPMRAQSLATSPWERAVLGVDIQVEAVLPSLQQGKVGRQHVRLQTPCKYFEENILKIFYTSWLLSSHPALRTRPTLARTVGTFGADRLVHSHWSRSVKTVLWLVGSWCCLHQSEHSLDWPRPMRVDQSDLRGPTGGLA